MKTETSLTMVEQRKLANNETIIRDHVESFMKVGNALAAIRDDKLYRDVDKTFEGYCNKRWGFTRQRAYQLIGSAKVIDVLSTMVDKTPPANERQARILADLPDEQTQATVWSKVVETAPKDKDGEPKITTAHIKRVADEVAPKSPKPEPTDNGAAVKESILQANADEEAEPAPEPTTADLCEADNKAIESFCRALVKYFEENVPSVVWTKAEGRIDSALASVKAGCGTLRQAKSVICPQCEEGEADGKKCPYCKGHGYLPKHKADQVAGVKA